MTLKVMTLAYRIGYKSLRLHVLYTCFQFLSQLYQIYILMYNFIYFLYCYTYARQKMDSNFQLSDKIPQIIRSDICKQNDIVLD